jgi:hypothetical protein
MPTFNTIADLRSINTMPVTADLYTVLGYDTPGDGGGGNFHWNPNSTTGDDGGIIIKANLFLSGFWKRDYDPTSGPVNLLWFGMKYNNDQSALYNYDTLIKMINLGYEILITDTIYFEPRKDGLGITAAKVIMSGNGPASKILFSFSTGYRTMFILPALLQEFSIKNIIWENTSSLVQLFFSEDHATFINQLQVSGCFFTGDFTTRIYGGEFPVGAAGAGEVIISNNEVRNAGNAWFTFVDCVYESFTIQGNRLYNMMESFFNDGITNITDQARMDLIRQNKKLLTIQDNTLINGATEIKTSGSNTYYVFVLTEANTCVYENNHVEGLKATYSVAIYDIYMSCDNGTYRHNTYKNNLSFGPAINAGSKAFFKGKAGKYKLVEYNTFLIEEAFITGMLAGNSGLNPDNTWVSYASFDTETVTNSKVYIRNNQFDAYYLNNTVLTNKEFLHYEISNNTFRFNRLTGSWIFADNSTISAPKQQRNFIFNNNTITKYGNGLLGNATYIVQGKNSSGIIQPEKDEIHLEINDNTFTGWNGTAITTITANSLVMNNNDIEAPINAVVSTAFCAGTYIEDITGSNNKFKTQSYNPSDLRINSYFKKSDVEFIFDIKTGTLVVPTGMCIMPVPYKKTYTRQYELSSAIYGGQTFEYSLRIEWDASTSKNYLLYHDYITGTDYRIQMGNPTVLGNGLTTNQPVLNIKSTDSKVADGKLQVYVTQSSLVLSLNLADGDHLVKIRQAEALVS